MDEIECSICHVEKGKRMIKNIKIFKLMEGHRGLGSSEQCYDVLYSIVRSFQVKTIVEIGTNLGYSAIVMTQAVLDNNDVPVVYSFDKWNNYGLNMEGTKEIAIHNIQFAGLSQYITLIAGDSVKTVPSYFTANRKVDMCFIDGDHTYNGVVTDYNNCKEHTDLIVFHDALCGKDVIDFLGEVSKDGWTLTLFPTVYYEGDRHPIGITLAQRVK